MTRFFHRATALILTAALALAQTPAPQAPSVEKAYVLASAEEREQLLRETLQYYRDAFVLCAETLFEGWPELTRKRILRFFTRETTPAYWLRLAEQDDRQRALLVQQETQGLVAPGTAAAFVGEAERQLRQWMLLDPDALEEEVA